MSCAVSDGGFPAAPRSRGARSRSRPRRPRESSAPNEPLSIKDERCSAIAVAAHTVFTWGHTAPSPQSGHESSHRGRVAGSLRFVMLQQWNCSPSVKSPQCRLRVFTRPEACSLTWLLRVVSSPPTACCQVWNLLLFVDKMSGSPTNQTGSWHTETGLSETQQQPRTPLSCHTWKAPGFPFHGVRTGGWEAQAPRVAGPRSAQPDTFEKDADRNCFDYQFSGVAAAQNAEAEAAIPKRSGTRALPTQVCSHHKRPALCPHSAHFAARILHRMQCNDVRSVKQACVSMRAL